MIEPTPKSSFVYPLTGPGFPEDNNAPTISPKSYLNRCLESINNSDSIAKTHDRYATAYKVAGFAVGALFIIAVVAAAILTIIYAPIFLPITTATALSLMNKVLNYTKKHFAKAASYQVEAQRTRSIKEEYQRLRLAENLLPSQVKISQWVPQLQAGIQYADLIPLLAHYNYWDGVQKSYQDRSEAMKREAGGLEAEKSVEKYVQASSLRQAGLIAKTCKAFTIAAMKNPRFEGEAADLCTIHNFNIPAIPSKNVLTASLTNNDWVRHAILRDFGDRRGEDFVVFRNQTIHPIIFRDALNLRSTELSERYLQAMTTAVPAAS